MYQSRMFRFAIILVVIALAGVAVGTLSVSADEHASINFDDQATASSTFTDDEPTSPGVVVEAATNEDSAVVITYEGEGDDLIIAGLDTFDAEDLDGSEQSIAVTNTDGFPGPHTAHIIPTDDLSDQEYSPGDTVSEETAEAVAVNEEATVFQGTVEFEDQIFEGALLEGSDEVVVDTADLLGDEDTLFQIDVHPTDGDGELVGTEFIGSSEVLSGENEEVSITLDAVPEDGDFNQFPISETDGYVAMLHVVDDEDVTEGDQVEPGTFPVLPNADATDGFVAGGVTDDATLTIEDGFTFADQATASSTITSDTVTDAGVVIEGAVTNQESAIVLTYEDDGDLIVAGSAVAAANAEGEDVIVEVGDAGGFPGEHTAHLIPTEDLSSEYEPGDTVSEDTAGAIITNEDATVFQGTLDFADQEFDDALEAGDEITLDTADLLGGAATNAEFVVDVHPTDDDGNVVAPEFVGSSDVLVGENEDVSVTLEQVPEDGDFNQLPIEETDSFVAMIHVVDDGAEAGADATPGQYPVLQNADATEGFVFGGITDDATLTIDDPDPDPVDPGDGTDDDFGFIFIIIGIIALAAAAIALFLSGSE